MSDRRSIICRIVFFLYCGHLSWSCIYCTLHTHIISKNILLRVSSSSSVVVVYFLRRTLFSVLLMNDRDSSPASSNEEDSVMSYICLQIFYRQQQRVSCRDEVSVSHCVVKVGLSFFNLFILWESKTLHGCFYYCSSCISPTSSVPLRRLNLPKQLEKRKAEDDPAVSPSNDHIAHPYTTCIPPKLTQLNRVTFPYTFYLIFISF